MPAASCRVAVYVSTRRGTGQVTAAAAGSAPSPVRIPAAGYRDRCRKGVDRNEVVVRLLHVPLVNVR